MGRIDPRMRAILPLALAVTLLAMRPAQFPSSATTSIVERAGKYVDAYLDAFSAVVSEEKQVQTLVLGDGRVRRTRAITADLLLVRTEGSWPQAYRDVIEVDGKPVHNREERLKKLFLEEPKKAPDLVKAINAESGRYNIGLERSGTSPLLPIIFLSPRVAEGVRFEGPAEDLTFQEVRKPTILRRRSAGGIQDMPAHGTFEIDRATGRVLSAEFRAEDTPWSVFFKVSYDVDPTLQISVPVELTERYWQPGKRDEDILTVHATYSSFRRFAVTTGEQIKK
jgi:hypothetical protein